MGHDFGDELSNRPGFDVVQHPVEVGFFKDILHGGHWLFVEERYQDFGDVARQGVVDFLIEIVEEFVHEGLYFLLDDFVDYFLSFDELGFFLHFNWLLRIHFLFFRGVVFIVGDFFLLVLVFVGFVYHCLGSHFGLFVVLGCFFIDLLLFLHFDFFLHGFLQVELGAREKEFNGGGVVGTQDITGCKWESKLFENF